MPCVNLTNTFRQWQTFKTLNTSLRKQRRQLRQAQKTARCAERTARLSAKTAAKLAAKQAQKTAKAAIKQRRLEQKAQKRLHRRQSKHGQPEPSKVRSTAPATTPTAASNTTPNLYAHEGEIWRVPHQRKNLLQDSATISQTLTAAISTQLHATAPQATPAEVQPPVAHNSAQRFITPTLHPINLKPGSSRADLINAESRLGSAIFGPIPVGHRREFFHDRQNVWIWHEDWQDQSQELHQMTVRYEVRTSGIYKKVSAGKYLRLEGDELENFRRATKTYLYIIKKYLYKTPATFRTAVLA